MRNNTEAIASILQPRAISSLNYMCFHHHLSYRLNAFRQQDCRWTMIKIPKRNLVNLITASNVYEAKCCDL